jgi:glycerophosphoryl diester phosphodiesterase
MTRSSPRVAPDRSPAERPHTPLVFGHRGGRALGPENTLTGFDLGIAAGADGLELDVHLAADGIPVVHHDVDLDRCTDATGPIAARTADELAHVDAGFRFGEEAGFPWRGRGVGVPMLSAVLARYRDVPLIIEIKTTSPKAPQAVVDAVRSATALGRVCVGSFNVDTLRAVRAIEPTLATSASRPEGQRALYRSWWGLGVGRVPYRAFQVPEQSGRLRVVSPRFIRAAHRANLAFQVWTVNDEADMRRLLDWGVDGLISDRPDEAVRVRDDWARSRHAARSRNDDGRPQQGVTS